MTGDGSPAAGWWRSGNGEWYPPELLPQGWSVGPDGVPRSFVMPAIMPPAPRGPTMLDRVAESYQRWPAWAKAAPVAVLLVVGTAAAAVALHDGGSDFDAVTPTRSGGVGATTVGATTGSIPPAPVSVNGLVITVPPTIAATTGPATVTPSESATTTTTTRLNSFAVPTSTEPSPTTVPPTVGATTTTVTAIVIAPTTTAPTTTAPTTTRVTTTSPTTTRVTTTSPTTTRVTTTAPTTTRVTTTTPTTTRAPVTHTVTGTVLVDARHDVSATCEGAGRFSSFRNGQTIVLSGPSGQVVGQGVLTGCRWTDWRFGFGSLTAKPEFSFTMTGVAEVSSYTPRVASMSWPAVSLTAMVNAGWTLDLEVQ